MDQQPGALPGKRAFVVGASSGIGQGIGRELSAAGAHVALAARRLDRLEQAGRAVRGGQVLLPVRGH